MALDKVTTAVIANDAITSDQLGVGAIAGSDIAADVIEVKPHIKPGTLYPAVAGKLLDGSTHSGNYGTAQSDGRSYFYTDLKDSKPIKDPRIGAHFGSQRHKFKSIQQLEKESLANNAKVYSIDGREWARVYAGMADSSAAPEWSPIWVDYGSHGTGSVANGGSAHIYYEITGYFSAVNMIGTMTQYSNRGYVYAVDGGAWSAEQTTWEGSVYSVTGGRYVDRGTLANIVSGQTLGIHTLRIRSHGTGDYVEGWGIELIAQDTTDTASKSKIQIPAQNVVSYGKKFSISAAAHHYDPFNGFTNDTTLFSSKVDTATSLGLGTGTTWGAPWNKGSDDHIRPFNGGRVVKWIDSSGNIKTSVTMMPPNAQNVKTLADNEITTASATNTHVLNFSDDAIDLSLSEVAKVFYAREFGNGNANGGAGGTYKDASMLDGSSRDITYVMDDGLTSLIGDDVRILTDSNAGSGGEVTPYDNGDYMYLTFIGTGIGVTSYRDGTSGGLGTVAINLPYGTHIFKNSRHNDAHPDLKVDGIGLTDIGVGNYGAIHEIVIYQPKMPPIPQDAVIIADYMLMADYVRQTSSGIDKISKGIRRVNASRDFEFTEDTNATFSFWVPPDFASSSGFAVEGNTTISSGNMYCQLPYFGTDVVVRTRGDRQGTDVTEYINSTSLGTITKSATGATYGEYIYAANTPALGLNGCKVNASSTSPSRFFVSDLEINTPIHTSSHYQTFETPYLKELVGGDRNMEQTNLVVTPDGKTWDQVTRDTSYIDDITKVVTNTDTAHVWENPVVFDEWRGKTSHRDYYNKDFAISYDRLICLVNGTYHIMAHALTSGDGTLGIKVNGATTRLNYTPTSNDSVMIEADYTLKRGDYIQIYGEWYNSLNYNSFSIRKA